MKKLLLFLFVLLSLHTFAQHKREDTDPYGTKALSFGPEVNIPNSSIFKVGYGVSGKAVWPVGDYFGVNATASYNRFFLKDRYLTPFNTGANVFVPVKVGMTFFWDEHIYANGNVGAVKQLNYSKETNVAYDFGFGYLLPIKGRSNLDIGFRYERWAKTLMRESVLRVAYSFDW
ncbi:hypothetical protein [Mucilaginibacter glaciei]|uniref:Outer membrane protein beta-barrel domain-containing protein n=1 Tax=Mucilaginibacter glaciei TaxID=2772109 RepID=A0A926NLB8_9SPHI|nr:hypothetical protein [Mucilaginibacter glaciei]MBD1394199.1 hypothetical protein [Mucilaginibacter glaciei]